MSKTLTISRTCSCLLKAWFSNLRSSKATLSITHLSSLRKRKSSRHWSVSFSRTTLNLKTSSSWRLITGTLHSMRRKQTMVRRWIHSMKTTRDKLSRFIHRMPILPITWWLSVRLASQNSVKSSGMVPMTSALSVLPPEVNKRWTQILERMFQKEQILRL